MNHDFPELLHHYQCVPIQIEVLKIRLALLKKGTLTEKKRLKFQEKLHALYDQYADELESRDENSLEYLLDLLQSDEAEMNPMRREYYRLDDIPPVVRIVHHIELEDDPSDQDHYGIADAYKPINSLNWAKSAKKENSYTPKAEDID